MSTVICRRSPSTRWAKSKSMPHPPQKRALSEFAKAHEGQFDEHLTARARNSACDLPSDAGTTKVREGKTGTRRALSDATLALLGCGQKADNFFVESQGTPVIGRFFYDPSNSGQPLVFLFKSMPYSCPWLRMRLARTSSPRKRE